jgi:predicted negative regulator of RcsB-dependent stress response
VEQYNTEEEQLEALRRWWDENGRSIAAAVILALSVSFGWQAWKSSEENNQTEASDIYQALLREISGQEATAEEQAGVALAEQLIGEYSGSTYAQFAALHLAAMAVRDDKLPEAEKQLRWVLAKAPKGSDAAQVAQLRLARVLAASGDSDQALVILNEASAGSYASAYAAAEGDILLAAGRNDEARESYQKALALAGSDGGRVNLPVLQQKMQNLSPVPGRAIDASPVVEAASESDDIVDVTEE